MTDQEFVIIVKAIKTYFPKERILENNEEVELWYDMIKDLNYNLALAELKKYVATHTFSPSISDIRECLIDFRTDKPLNSSEAWSLVLNTLEEVDMHGNGKMRYDELPEMVKTAIGGYPQFREWMNNPSFNKEVEKSAFIKIYQKEELKERDFLKLPADIKRLINKRNEVVENLRQDV